jgi:hypothetical protein
VRQLFLNKSFSSFIVILILLLLPCCENKQNTVIDSTGNAPIIAQTTFSLSVINTDTMNVGPERKPNDILTIRGIASAKVTHVEGKKEIKLVNCYVMRDPSSSSIGSSTLHDDGVEPDITENDSIFSGYVNFQIIRVEVGIFCLQFSSENYNSFKSNSFFTTLQIVRLNHPPFLSNLQTDSLVSIGGVDHILQIRIAASDSDGQSDIQKVFFNSFKPDGSPAIGNPFLMLDDGDPYGTSGDLTLGDGTYGLKVILLRTTTPGTYRFEFHATDRSLESSNPIIKNIVITY